MWFLFGFITIISFSLFFGWHRFIAGWKGTPASAGESSYQFKVHQGKYGPVGFRIGIGGPQHMDFTLKPESWYDRLFKRIGITSEYQVGESEFDEMIYILADNPVLCEELSYNDALRQAALAIFKSGSGNKSRISRIRCMHGRLWVEYKVKSGFDTAQITDVAETVVPMLESMTGILESKTVLSGIRDHKDKFVYRAAILLSLSTGMAINALVQTLRFIFFHVPFTVDLQSLIFDSFKAGAVLVSVLIMLAFILLGRSARTHLVLIELVLVGFAGATGSAFFALRDMNMELDSGAGEQFIVEVRNKKITRGKSTTYYLFVEDWIDPDATRKVTVDGSLYRSVGIGDAMQVQQHPGHFGYRWVSRFEKTSKPEHATSGDGKRLQDFTK